MYKKGADPRKALKNASMMSPQGNLLKIFTNRKKALNAVNNPVNKVSLPPKKSIASSVSSLFSRSSSKKASPPQQSASPSTKNK